MQPFSFAAPQSVSDAVAAAAGNAQARFVAGGTTLLDLMKLDVETPSELLDIHRLPLAEITELPEGGVRIGAMVSNSALAYHPLIQERYPLLSQAVLSGASAQLRNMATVGGNLMQRTRCTYFRDLSWACNKRNPGSGCAAKDGHHRSHAIFGTSEHCFATHPSDMCVALAALDATVAIEGRDGPRRVPFGDFHTLPGDTPHIETVLRQGELIAAVELPQPLPGKAAYLKVRDRESYEFALVSVAAVLDLSGATIRGARIAFGGVATKPWRAYDVEEWLAGKAAGRDLFQRSAELAVAGAAPSQENRFKVELVKRALIRTLEDLTGEVA